MKRYDPKRFVSARVYASALKAVNELRKTAGRRPLTKLPNGAPRAACCCPIARALTSADESVLVSPRVLCFGGRRPIKAPHAIRTFVHEFDRNTSRHMEQK